MKVPHELNSGCTTGSQVIDESQESALIGPADVESLSLRLVCEMQRRWKQGERPLAEEFLSRHDQLKQSPEAAIDLIYEEFCQRQAASERAVEADILRRFPQWREQLRIMMDCHRVLEPSGAAPDFPSAGETVAGFRLVEKLGRGSRGRVVLATQTDLAARHVVLKITPLDGVEHLSLARLQHTNIVPVYSVVDDPDRSIRILCMPYFGRATLASLLDSLAAVPHVARTGPHFLAAIDRRFDPTREPVPAAAAARQMLAHVSYVQATCWVAASLADALQFAHDHGLVHLDVKPSNVLLAGNGQPMLLDFHLAREPIRRNGPLPDKFGGTPAYMPPEQRAAMLALRTGHAIETDVDARADIYSLGAILYEMLGGTMPFPKNGSNQNSSYSGNASDSRAEWKPGDSPPAAPLSKHNPLVSIGLSDIVAKCLAPTPADRYPTAAALAEDLRRHLADQPLTGVPNRSFAERWRKRRRRNPYMHRIAGMFGLIVAAIALALVTAGSQLKDRCLQAEQALRDGQAKLERGEQPGEAVAFLERGLTLIDGLTIRRDLAGQLRQQLAKARRLQVVNQLHEIADQLRELPGTETLPTSRLVPLSKLCGEFWNKRQQIADSLDASSDTGVAMDLLDVAIFCAELHVQLASESDVAAARQRAIGWLDEAEAKFGPSPVLEYQRRIYQNRAATSESSVREEIQNDSAAFAGLGRRPPADTARRRAWERYALGRALLSSNQLELAMVELTAARTIEPAGQWPNFYYGLCAYRMGRHEEAVEAFSVCIGAAPTLAGCFYNRALAHAALGRTNRAHQDLDRAIELDPALAAAWLNRGMSHYKLRQFTEAVADLEEALQRGARPAAVHYNLALVHLEAQNAIAALAALDRTLEIEPGHGPARELRESIRRGTASFQKP